jgi:hypothetical protein
MWTAMSSRSAESQKNARTVAVEQPAVIAIYELPEIIIRLELD